MPNDDAIPLLPRLLLAAAGLGLPPARAALLGRLGTALALGLPVRSLPLALLRLRGHLRPPPRGRSDQWGRPALPEPVRQRQRTGSSSSATRRR
ncbi:hypothetical protein B0T42_08895 [Rathayibacter sp. VKM Ac-2630]|nr:hypothetical protein B0T42_08895 [Rathayibacter sp. VKM Ac-2630]